MTGNVTPSLDPRVRLGRDARAAHRTGHDHSHQHGRSPGQQPVDRKLAEALAIVIDAGIHAWWLGNPTVLEPGRLEWDLPRSPDSATARTNCSNRFGARVTDRILGWTAMTECGQTLGFPPADLPLMRIRPRPRLPGSPTSSRRRADWGPVQAALGMGTGTGGRRGWFLHRV